MSGADRPRFASVVLDVDSTVSGVEGIDWLAALRGDDAAARIAMLTDRAMRGALPLEAVYGARLAEIKPTPAEVDALARVYVDQIAPGCAAAVARLQSASVRVVLVSGGLRNAMEPLARHLRIKWADVHAVEVRFNEAGTYAGFDETSPLATAGGKGSVIASLGLARPILMVGDGATDLAARGEVDSFAAFVGFVTRITIVRSADMVFSSFSELAAAVVELD